MDRRVPLRIEGQAPLSELKEEEGHEAYAAEPEEVAGIGFPRHLFLFIYSADPVYEALQGQSHGAQQVPPALEDRSHIAAHERGEGREHDEKDDDVHHVLGHEIDLHPMSEC